MRILIVASSTREVVKLSEQLSFQQQIDSNLRSYIYGKLQVDVLISGFGSAILTYNLTRTLNMISYDLAIYMGLAGSFDHFLEQGFVVNVIQDQFADLGFEQANNFYTLAEEELMDENAFPFTDGKMFSLGSFELEEVESLIPVKSITVNTLRSNAEWIKNMREKYDPEIETMNGAGFFYTCLNEKIPFLQICAIASFVEIRRIENWNIPLAIKNLTGSIVSILKELNKDIE